MGNTNAVQATEDISDPDPCVSFALDTCDNDNDNDSAVMFSVI